MKTNAALIAAACSLLAAPAFAGPPACDARTTTGYWVARCEGELPAPTPTSTRTLSTCVASRTGFFSCTGTANVGGMIVSQTVQGQAINNPDCTGTIHYEQQLGGQPAPPLDINYVILDDGDTIWGLPLNTGTAVACTLRRLSDGKGRGRGE
jgi:hypothetical protein